jgi:hypothetical protein
MTSQVKFKGMWDITELIARLPGNDTLLFIAYRRRQSHKPTGDAKQ